MIKINSVNNFTINESVRYKKDGKIYQIWDWRIKPSRGYYIKEILEQDVDGAVLIDNGPGGYKIFVYAGFDEVEKIIDGVRNENVQ